MFPPPATLQSRQEGEVLYALSLSPDLEAFQGHFPGDPLLPGVVQVDWAIRLGIEAFGPMGDFLGIDQLKFLAPVRPLEALELKLTQGPGRLTFHYHCGQDRKSSGTVRFQDAP